MTNLYKSSIYLRSQSQQALKDDKLWSEMWTCTSERQILRYVKMKLWFVGSAWHCQTSSCYQVEVTKGDVSNLCGSLCTFLFLGNQPFNQHMLKGGHERNVALQIEGFCGVDPLAARSALAVLRVFSGGHKWWVIPKALKPQTSVAVP